MKPKSKSQKPTGFSLRKATVVVTGAGSGIGRELALAFARERANLVCVGRRLPLVQETAAMIRATGGTAMALATDVTDQKQVQAMVRRILKKFKHIDLLFNNAGSFASVGPVWHADPEVWWRDVTINLLGPALCSMAVLPHMMKRQRGVIINMDGGGGGCGPDIVLPRLGGKARSAQLSGPNLGGSAYGCSKAGLMRFSEGLARELQLAGSPVMVFGLNPGFVRSPMTEGLIASGLGKKWQAFVGKLFHHRAERPPTDCAAAALALLRIASLDLSGCVFDVDTDFAAVTRQKKNIARQSLYLMRLRDPRAM